MTCMTQHRKLGVWIWNSGSGFWNAEVTSSSTPLVLTHCVLLALLLPRPHATAVAGLLTLDILVSETTPPPPCPHP